MKYLLFIITLCMVLPATSVFAEDQMYGSQMMSEQERQEYTTKMKSIKTAEERHRYELEHRKMIEERAKEQEKSLSDMPQNRNNTMDKSGSGISPSGSRGGGRK